MKRRILAAAVVGVMKQYIEEQTDLEEQEVPSNRLSGKKWLHHILKEPQC